MRDGPGRRRRSGRVMDRQSLDVDTLGGGRVRHGLQMDRERGAGWMEGQNRPPAPGGGLWRSRAEPCQHWRFGESNEPWT